MQVENTLSKIFDATKIQNLLSNLKTEQLDIFIWKLLGDSKYLAPVKIEAIRKVRGDFVISSILGHEEEVNELLAGSGSIDFYVPSTCTLFRAKIKHSESNRFYFEIPEFIAQAERRQIERLNVFDDDSYNLKFLKKVKTYKEISQNFDKRCFDISAGGFSFFISKTESQFFKVNDTISNAKLKIGDWETFLEANIVRIIEIEPDEVNGLKYKALLVSCAFKNLNDISKKQLENILLQRFQDELHVINS